MTPLEEKVARAVTQRTMEIAGFWATLPTVTAQQRALDLAYKEAEPIARAAIAVVVEAMRKPTPGMVAIGAAEARTYDSRYETGEDTAPEVWRLMLEEFERSALSPTTPEGRGP